MPEQILYFHTYPELEIGSPRERDESLRGVHLAFCAEWRKGGLAAAEPHLVLVPEPYRELTARELARRFLALNFPEVRLGRTSRETLVGTYQLGPLNLAYVFLRTSLPSLANPVWPEASHPGQLALPAPREPRDTCTAPKLIAPAEAAAVRPRKPWKAERLRRSPRRIHAAAPRCGPAFPRRPRRWSWPRCASRHPVLSRGRLQSGSRPAPCKRRSLLSHPGTRASQSRRHAGRRSARHPLVKSSRRLGNYGPAAPRNTTPGTLPKRAACGKKRSGRTRRTAAYRKVCRRPKHGASRRDSHALLRKPAAA